MSITSMRAYVRTIRLATPCAHCGAPMHDWHNEDHVSTPERRVCNMVKALCSIEEILAEIAVCIPLCRGCHMREDGRLQRFEAMGNAQRFRKEPPKPCHNCSTPCKALRHGRCHTCDAYFGRRGVERPSYRYAQTTPLWDAKTGAAACIVCGTNDRPHYGRSLCKRCWEREYMTGFRRGKRRARPLVPKSG